MIRASLSKLCGGEAYTHAAPVIQEVEVFSETGKAHPKKWDALLDTGADRSALPIAIFRELGAGHRDRRRVQGCVRSSAPQLQPVFWVWVRAPGLREVKLRAFGLQRTNILLGRDFLQGLVLALDGRTSSWAVDDAASWWTTLCLKLSGLE